MGKYDNIDFVSIEKRKNEGEKLKDIANEYDNITYSWLRTNLSRWKKGERDNPTNNIVITIFP